jgi:hypothetical protein
MIIKMIIKIKIKIKLIFIHSHRYSYMIIPKPKETMDLGYHTIILKVFVLLNIKVVYIIIY